MKNRIWEIDFLRGIAISLMVVFHIIYDLKEFFQYDIEYSQGFWFFVGKSSAVIFMLVSGISSNFSRNNLQRGGKIFIYGIGITLITFFYNPKTYIRFGILHLLGISNIIYHFICKGRSFFLYITSFVLILLGRALVGKSTISPYLFPIGLVTKEFTSLDYYPLIPWFGVFLLGAALGKTIYKKKQSLFPFQLKACPLSYIGKHSLFIYLVHQPIIIGLLYLIHKIFVKK